MARKEIRIPLDRENRNDVNSNFKELYDQLNDIIGTITDEIIQEILEEALRDSKLVWKEFVDTFEDLPAEADTGDVHYVVEDGTFYRWDGEEWTPIQEIDLSYINTELIRLDRRIDDLSGLNEESTTLEYDGERLVKVEVSDGDELKKEITLTYNPDDYLESILEKTGDISVVTYLHYTNGNVSYVTKKMNEGED